MSSRKCFCIRQPHVEESIRAIVHLRGAVEVELTCPEGGYPRYRTPKEDIRASVRVRMIEPSAAENMVEAFAMYMQQCQWV